MRIRTLPCWWSRNYEGRDRKSALRRSGERSCDVYISLAVPFASSLFEGVRLIEYAPHTTLRISPACERIETLLIRAISRKIVPDTPDASHNVCKSSMCPSEVSPGSLFLARIRCPQPTSHNHNLAHIVLVAVSKTRAGWLQALLHMYYKVSLTSEAAQLTAALRTACFLGERCVSGLELCHLTIRGIPPAGAQC